MSANNTFDVGTTSFKFSRTQNSLLKLAIYNASSINVTIDNLSLVTPSGIVPITLETDNAYINFPLFPAGFGDGAYTNLDLRLLATDILVDFTVLTGPGVPWQLQGVVLGNFYGATITNGIGSITTQFTVPIDYRLNRPCALVFIAN